MMPMHLLEREIQIPPIPLSGSLIRFFEEAVQATLSSESTPLRFVVSESDEFHSLCEIGVVEESLSPSRTLPESIFRFRKRKIRKTKDFNAVFVVPTGIGAEIGGHAGDATPVARLLASACDTLVTHPNVVNAGDINEQPQNTLYVEGSTLTRLLMGTVALERTRSNRVIFILNGDGQPGVVTKAILACVAEQASSRMICPYVLLDTFVFHMTGTYTSAGRAVGEIHGIDKLVQLLDSRRSDYDAVAIASMVEVPEAFREGYFMSNGEIVNPWGGAEAVLTHAISSFLNVPSAHAPLAKALEIDRLRPETIDPRMAAEAISSCFLHCIFKGLHDSPRIITDPALLEHDALFSAKDVSCLIIPDGCIGLSILAAFEQGIPVIAVRENRNCMRNDLRRFSRGSDLLYIVDNYHEAAGVLLSLKAGISPKSVRRPLTHTQILTEPVRHNYEFTPNRQLKASQC